MAKLQGGISDKKSALGSLAECELWPKIREILDKGDSTMQAEMKNAIQEFVEKYLKRFEEDKDVKEILLDVVMERIQDLTVKYKEKAKKEGR